MTIEEASDQAVAGTRTTAEQPEALNELAIEITRKLFAMLEEQAVDEIAAKHGGFRARFFSTDADFLEGGDVAKRSALQIDKQVTPLVRLFGWETLISRDYAIWTAPMAPHVKSIRAGGRKRAQQPILRWRVSEPGILELTGFDGEIELIACQQQLLMRLLEFGAGHGRMGSLKSRGFATRLLGILMQSGKSVDAAQ